MLGPFCANLLFCAALSPALVCWASACPVAQGWKAPRHFWFPLKVERHPLISCFNIQEAGGKEERGIDQSSEVKVSKRGREGWKRTVVEMEGKGDERRKRMERGVEWASELQDSGCLVWMCVCVFLRFPADWACASQCSIFSFQVDGWIDISYPAVFPVCVCSRVCMIVCVCARVCIYICVHLLYSMNSSVCFSTKLLVWLSKVNLTPTRLSLFSSVSQGCSVWVRRRYDLPWWAHGKWDTHRYFCERNSLACLMKPTLTDQYTHSMCTEYPYLFRHYHLLLVGICLCLYICVYLYRYMHTNSLLRWC